MTRVDAQAFVYIASTMKTAARSAAGFQKSAENMIEAINRMGKSLHTILEQYYFDREAEARWADDGGPCD